METFSFPEIGASLDLLWSFHSLKGLVVGFIIAFLINLTGVGGGVIIIPLLVLLFGMPPSVAIGTASIYSTITKIMSCADHISRKNVNFLLSKKILIIALPSTLLSSLIVNLLLVYAPQYETMVQSFLSTAILGIMLLSCYLIYNQNKISRSKTENKEASHFSRVIISMIIGFVMGATGIGGGILLIPALLFISKDDIKYVVGSSIFIALILSAVTALIYSSGDQSDISLLAIMLLGSLAAIPLSGKINHRLNSQTISYLTIALILVSGTMVVIT